MTKYIFVSGGVVSGLGKGIATASVALLLKSLGFRVAPVKIDMYLNVDAGTIRPLEHGETFVTKDGLETDEDIGHYERFLNQDLTRVNYITTGQIYQEVIRKERALEYEGEDVEAIPHVTDEIIRRVKLAGSESKAEVVVIELGGTVGEYQNSIFFEASRIMKLKNPNDAIHIHVTYLPLIASLGELKSKPAQTSVHILNGMGIHPDIIVARSEKPIDQRRLDRLALFCNISPDCIFASPDIPNVYEAPLLFKNPRGEIVKVVLNKLHLKNRGKPKMDEWRKMVKKSKNLKDRDVVIGVVAKYYRSGDGHLSDAYISVLESIKHASYRLGIGVKLKWIDSEKLVEERDLKAVFSGLSGVIIPQGWGSRGVEGKIKAVQFARKNKIPYLGLCFGMQMAVIEFARDVLGLDGANSTEADPKTPHPVIHVMPEQKEYLSKRQYGGTIRLGQWPCQIKKGTVLSKAYLALARLRPSYGQETVMERHRHRYEVNNTYRQKLEENGMIISGTSPDNQLVEAIELQEKIHPFFIGTQFHPEYQSRPLSPHPLFLAFIKAAANRKIKK